MSLGNIFAGDSNFSGSDENGNIATLLIGRHSKAGSKYADHDVARVDIEGSSGIFRHLEKRVAFQVHLALVLLKKSGIADTRSRLQNNPRAIDEIDGLTAIGLVDPVQVLPNQEVCDLWYITGQRGGVRPAQPRDGADDDEKAKDRCRYRPGQAQSPGRSFGGVSRFRIQSGSDTRPDRIGQWPDVLRSIGVCLLVL